MTNQVFGRIRYSGIVAISLVVGALHSPARAAEPPDDCARNLDPAANTKTNDQQIREITHWWKKISANNLDVRSLAPDAIELAVLLQSPYDPRIPELSDARDLIDSTQALMGVEIASGRRYDQGSDLDKIEALDLELQIVKADIARVHHVIPAMVPMMNRRRARVVAAEKEKLELETKLRQAANNPEAHELARQMLDAQARMIVFEAKGDGPKADFLRYHTIPLFLQSGAHARFYNPQLTDGVVRARDVLRYVKMKTHSIHGIGNPIPEYLERNRRKALMTEGGPLDREDARYVAQQLLEESIEYLRTERDVKMIYGKDVAEALLAQQKPSYVSVQSLRNSMNDNFVMMMSKYSISKSNQIEGETLEVDVVRNEQGEFQKFVLSANNQIIGKVEAKKVLDYHWNDIPEFQKSSEPQAQIELNLQSAKK